MQNSRRPRPVRPAHGFALAALLLSASCVRVPPPRETPPYENLLTLLAEFRRFVEHDVYRHGVPKDMSGQNAFRATLHRLDSYEERNPDNNSDIVSFTRGQALARLSEFKAAGTAFERTARITDSRPLAEKALTRAAAMRRFAKALGPAPRADRLSAYMEDVEARRTRLSALLDDLGDSTDAALAARELERADEEYALALIRNRFVLDRGTARAVEFAEKMLENHARSHRLYAHRLAVGQLYFELARDLVSFTPPGGLDFDAGLFAHLIENARRQFVLISHADGYPEKPEGAALLGAIEAFAARVRRQAE